MFKNCGDTEGEDKFIGLKELMHLFGAETCIPDAARTQISDKCKKRNKQIHSNYEEREEENNCCPQGLVWRPSSEGSALAKLEGRSKHLGKSRWRSRGAK